MTKTNIFNKKRIVIGFFIFLCSIVSIQAATTYLVKLTNTTYVTSYHPDNYLADTYTGTVSIRGKDRFFEGKNTCAPTQTSIKYDVQGSIYSTYINATSTSDATQRKKQIEVKDKWNLGSSTKVYGNYKSKIIGNAQPYSENSDTN